MRLLASKGILGSSSAYFPLESVAEILVKSSVTREDGGQKEGWWKERRKGGRVMRKLLDTF